MGTFEANLAVSGLAGGKQTTVQAMVDTGATYVSLPATLLRELDVQPTERRTFVLSDGRQAEYQVGFALASLDGRSAPTIVVFADEGSQPLIGAVLLETLGLAADPVGKRLVPVPAYLLASSACQPVLNRFPRAARRSREVRATLGRRPGRAS